MAKFLFVIVCACYCTVCVHLMTTTLAEASATAATKTHTTFNQDDNDYVTSGNRQNKNYLNDILNEDKLDIEESNENIDSKLLSISNEKINDIKKQIGRRKTRKLYSTINDVIAVNRDNLDTVAIRAKRHSIVNGNDDDHNEFKISDNVHMNPNSQLFIKKMFEEYGDAEKQTMTFEGFEKMLRQLGMDHLIENYQSQRSIPSLNPVDEQPLTKNETCLSVHSLLTRMFPQKENKYSSAASQRAMENNNENSLNKLSHQLINENNTKTVAPTDQISTKKFSVSSNVTTANNSSDSNKKNLFLDKFDLWSLCPILLYQLTAPTSLERSGCIKSDSLPFISTSHHDHDHLHDEHDDDDHDHLKVWIYASLSITIASLCGLLGVAVIPCMERRYYQQMLQFFVALGIGTLAGDALLHLMPHAMLTFSSTENVHASMTWKGLVATLGIIFFFLTERLLTMIAEWRKQIQKRDDPPARVRVMRDLDNISLSRSLNGEKQCKHKYSSYPYCYDEIALDTKDDHHQHHQHGNEKSHSKENGMKATNTVPSMKDKLHTKSIPGEYETAQSLLSGPNHNYTISDGYFKDGDEIEKEELENKVALTNLNDGSVESCGCSTKKAFTPENFTIILREHESKHHGHSHTHGHVHSPPKTLSAVAWMVVMGDGLHNFTDGMAIGAAFSNSIAGGFSTAIAVFCHELPHELGDFAVLLKAGMSAKKAVYYNILSSVLSLFGMILGIIVGDTPEASAWIFACAAGMFIYIALVDMMPELATAHKENSALLQCLIQLIGMVIGVGIMLVIALYEDDLRFIFSTNSHAHSHDHHHHQH